MNEIKKVVGFFQKEAKNITTTFFLHSAFPGDWVAGGEGAALALVAKRRAKLPPPERGAAARHAICDAVGAAVSLPFAEGMQLEAQLINRLMRTPQSAALRHVFFATRAVSKLEELAPSALTLTLTLTLALTLTTDFDANPDPDH